MRCDFLGMEDLIQAVETLRPPVAVASAPRMDRKQSATLTPRLGFHRGGVDLVRDDACVRPVDGARRRGASLGRWLTDNGNLEIEIAPCGAELYDTVTQH